MDMGDHKGGAGRKQGRGVRVAAGRTTWVRSRVDQGEVIIAPQGMRLRNMQTGRSRKLGEDTLMVVERVDMRGPRGISYLVEYERLGRRQRAWVDERDVP